MLCGITVAYQDCTHFQSLYSDEMRSSAGVQLKISDQKHCETETTLTNELLIRKQNNN